MPIYEYQCGKCGTFEITQRITEKSLSRCPTCKGKVKKLISNTSFQLKGTGWYVTDYARKDQASTSSKGAKAPAAESKGESKSAAAGSDAKSASTAEKSTTKTTSESASASN
jgi:putative FmdB family regulatory protein